MKNKELQAYIDYFKKLDEVEDMHYSEFYDEFWFKIRINLGSISIRLENAAINAKEMTPHEFQEKIINEILSVFSHYNARI